MQITRIRIFKDGSLSCSTSLSWIICFSKRRCPRAPGPASTFHRIHKMSTFELIPSGRGGYLLCVNNNIFRKARNKNGIDYYYCCEQDCKSTARINNGVLISLSEQHDHPSVEDKIRNMKIVSNLRKRAAEEPLISIPSIYRYKKPCFVYWT